MAKAMTCSIKIIHFLDTSGILELEENPMRLLKEIDRMEKKAEQRLKRIAKKILENDVDAKTEVLKGSRLSWLISYLEKEKPDLVVMGTQGNNSIANTIFGSETYKVIRNTGIPTLAIPQKASFKGLHKIIFAIDYEKRNVDNIKFLIKIAEYYKTSIDIVHVTDINLTKEEKLGYMVDLNNEFPQSISFNKLDIKLLYSTNVAERLNTLLKESNAELLVLVARKRNFIDRLFNKSLTKSMVYHTQTPLLIFS
jgi:nucleotide-binding universal stress UspA family protein